MNAVSKEEAKADHGTPISAASGPMTRPRKKRTALMLAVPSALLLGGGFVWLSGGRNEKTDNANLHQARVAIASDVSGRVTEVDFVDNQPVKVGDVLFRIDPEPYRLALTQAEAAITSARLDVEQMKADYAPALAKESMARDEVVYQTTEVERQTAHTSRGVTSETA